MKRVQMEGDLSEKLNSVVDWLIFESQSLTAAIPIYRWPPASEKDMISPLILSRLCFLSCNRHDEPLYEPLYGFGVLMTSCAFLVQFWACWAIYTRMHALDFDCSELMFLLDRVFGRFLLFRCTFWWSFDMDMRCHWYYDVWPLQWSMHALARWAKDKNQARRQ